MGLGNKNKKNEVLTEVGQAQKAIQSSNKVLGLNNVKVKILNRASSLGSAQPHVSGKEDNASTNHRKSPGSFLSQDSTGSHLLNHSTGLEKIHTRVVSDPVSPGLFLASNKQFHQRPGYCYDLETASIKKFAWKATSVPVIQQDIDHLGSKVRKRVNPKLKEKFGLGNILKWSDFAGQESRKQKENSNLSMHNPGKETRQVSNKPTLLHVYTRNY